VCVQCFILKVTEPSPLGARDSRKRAAYSDPPVVPHPESLAAQGGRASTDFSQAIEYHTQHISPRADAPQMGLSRTKKKDVMTKKDVMKEGEFL